MAIPTGSNRRDFGQEEDKETKGEQVQQVAESHGSHLSLVCLFVSVFLSFFLSYSCWINIDETLKCNSSLLLLLLLFYSWHCNSCVRACVCVLIFYGWIVTIVERKEESISIIGFVRLLFVSYALRVVAKQNVFFLLCSIWAYCCKA